MPPPEPSAAKPQDDEVEKCGDISLYSTVGVNDWRCDLPKGHDGVHIAFTSHATMSWGSGDDPRYA